jgi:hypothetical protein
METNTDITIDGYEASWAMPRLEGELGTYTGVFKFKCYLNPISQLQAGRDYRELLGSLAAQATDGEANLAFALTQLKHRIVSAPPFWTSTAQDDGGIQGNIGDINVILAVLDAAIRSEQLFKDKIAKEREALLNRSIKVAEKIVRTEEK